MKKLFLLLLVMVAAFQAKAGDYAYLTFETTDGAKASVPVSGLTIAVDGTVLTTGGMTFALSNLSRMYFSVSDETSGIVAVSVAELDEAADIYDLNGRRQTKEKLQKGVYVMKTENGTCKIVVR